MMNIAFFWFPIVLAHTTPAAAPAQEIPAGPAWAQAVTERADKGWHLRGVESNHDAQGISISLTLASDSKAEQFSVRYAPSDKSFTDFAKTDVALPTEDREYAVEGRLFEEFSTGAPVAIDSDCADFYLDFGSSSVSLADDAFSVALWSTGRKPGPRLASWLSTSLAEGQLIDIRDERIDDGAEVVGQVIFVVDSAEGVEEMTVELSAQGAPVHLQVEHSPGGAHWAQHPSSEALRELAKSSSIRRLQFAAEGVGEAPQLKIDATGQSSILLDLGAFTADEEECDC